MIGTLNQSDYYKAALRLMATGSATEPYAASARTRSVGANAR